MLLNRALEFASDFLFPKDKMPNNGRLRINQNTTTWISRYNVFSSVPHSAGVLLLLCRSTHEQVNKRTQLAKRTLIKVGGSSQYWFQLLTVISKMQSVLEFNDVRSVSVIRLDRRYDTQASPIRRAPSPSYAGSAPNCDVDQNGVLTQLLPTF